MEKEPTYRGDKKAADVIRKVLTNKFERYFKELAASGATFADAFALDQDEEETSGQGLVEEVQAFRNCLREGPVPVNDSCESQFKHIPGDEEAEYMMQVRKQVVTARKSSIQFIPTGMLAGPDFWKKGGKATALFQRSKFNQASGEAGKQNHLVLLCAELFPTKELFESAAPHKDPVPVTHELKQAAKWGVSAQGGSTVCLFTDGRSKKVRRVLEDLVEEHQTDEQKQLEGCILYGAPRGKDVRFHKRNKTFGALANLEKLLGVLPVPKVRMISKERDHFGACGENSTHASSYTNVPIREVARLSRLSLLDKESITGSTLPTYCERVNAATGVRGHPLFWGEIKEVEVFVALFHDLQVSHVYDLCAGSGAAAMAAGICGIVYEGLAINSEHANWLNRLIDKAMFAIIADHYEDDETKQLRTDLAKYFGAAIEEARRLLTSDVAVDGDEDDVDEDGGDDGEV